MRLLIVTHYYPEHRGGIEIVAGELARRLERKGFDISWAASDDVPPHGAPGATPMRTWNIAERRLGFPYPLWSFNSLCHLRGLIEHTDVVHLHDSLYAGNFIASRMARRLNKPVVVTQHAGKFVASRMARRLNRPAVVRQDIGETPSRNPVMRNLVKIANLTVARRVLGSCEQAIFISPRVRAYFGRFVHFRRPPLYIPNGVDTTTFRPAADREAVRKQLGWSLDRPALFFAGRFVEKKGLTALQDVALQRPDCDVILAGWGPINPQAWELPNVRCVGSLKAADLAKCYQAADLLLLPSVGEGFPLVIQEAAACGTPALIARETADGHEEVQHFTYCCEPDGASVLAKVTEILANRDELTARRERAARFAAERWDWDMVTDQYACLFETIAAKRTCAT